MYNLVIVKQENGKYLFMVDDEHKYSVKAGDPLILATVRGEKMGTAMCDCFMCNDDTAEMIMNSFGAQKQNMKFVIGKAKFERWMNTDD